MRVIGARGVTETGIERIRDEARPAPSARPVGWCGQPLKEMLEESERLHAETGRYWGIDRLELKERDPIGYEKMFAKLRGGLVTARETAKRVAASPIVEQEGECCFALYTPEGDSITLSTGIIVHVHTMSDAIKYMIRNDYEENPGIFSGDIFCNNDPHVGDVHPCDVATIIPLFWEDELIGWMGGVTHVIDIGAVSPGSMAVGPVDRFGDGYYIAARKVGANDVLFRDWVLEAKKMIRTPSYWTLDERTRLTGCFMARDVVMSLIREMGIETYKQFIREVVEEGRRGFVAEIRTLMVPGRYRQVSFVDVPFKGLRVPPYADKHSMMHAPSEVVITRDGRFEVSFEGANEWGWHSFNCTPSGMQGGIWVLLTQTVIPNEKVNDGAYFACRFHFPPGSWANPQDTQTAHAYSWHFLVSCWSPLWRALSRGYFARGLLEEVNAGNANTSNWLQGGGVDQYERLHAVNSFEASSEGTGASAVRDGVDHAAAVWNPEGDMGDMEVWELNEPLIFLGRQVKPNTAGYGKYRGGSGYESLRMVWKARNWVMYFMGNGYVQSDCGLFGGYPAAAGYRLCAHGTDLKGRFARGDGFPTGGDTDPDNPDFERLLNGRVEREHGATTTPDAYADYDLYLNYLRGGPGLGDPLERTPERIAEDLNGGYLLPRFAERVYGAVVHQLPDRRWHVSLDETAERRGRMREERQRRARPVREWMGAERERILAGQASEWVKDMYRSSMKLSEQFAREFRSFWELPGDWLPWEGSE